MRTWRGLAVAGVALLGLVAGCSGGGNNGNSGGSGAAERVAGPQDAAGGPAKAAPGADSDGGTSSGGNSNGSGTGNASARIVPDRALIRTADLSVRVGDVAEQARRAVQVATAAGGEVFSDERGNSGTPDRGTADITLKVPPNSLDGVLDQLSRLGKEESRRTSTEDVTEQVADVESRVASARASLARLRALYGKAGTIAEITALEGDLSQRESDLESLQARQRALGAQTASATVTLHLRGIAAPAATTATDNSPDGFWGGLKGGWHVFAVSAAWVFTAVGALLPFLVLAALAAYAALWIRRRRPHPAPVGPALPQDT
jgi:hypothetical protein